jgi:hypothetical protein
MRSHLTAPRHSITSIIWMNSYPIKSTGLARRNKFNEAAQFFRKSLGPFHVSWTKLCTAKGCFIHESLHPLCFNSMESTSPIRSGCSSRAGDAEDSAAHVRVTLESTLHIAGRCDSADKCARGHGPTELEYRESIVLLQYLK